MKHFLRYSFTMALMLICAMGSAKTVNVYKKATAIESGKAYLIAADVDGKLKVATLNTQNYGYLNVVETTETDGTIEQEDGSNDFVFTATDGGYTIQMSNGKYLYQKGTYNSFNFDAAPTEGQVWTVEPQADGTFKITNVSVNKYVQYSTEYKSYGSYANAQDGAKVPTLYVFDSTKEVADANPDAKGQKANPYTVAEIQAIAADAYPSGKVWVKGYIAGCVNTGKGSELAASNDNETNIGLSATADATTVIPIQLPKGDVRTALNLVANASNLGKEVLLQGEVQKYCGVTGVKNTAAYEFTGNSVTITTNIGVVEAETANAPAYNLAGQQVDGSYKGVVIKNGKKAIQK